jgi:hypothetical protein
MSRPFIFISYSHKDEKLKDQLLSHLDVLQRAGLIELWSDDRIGAGADWETEINQAISRARVAILLISASFLTSDFILGKTVPALLKRRECEGLIIFPIIAKACAWQAIDWLAEMNVRPQNGKPIWSDADSHVDEKLAAIAKEIALIVGDGELDFITSTHRDVHEEVQRTKTLKPEDDTGVDLQAGERSGGVNFYKDAAVYGDVSGRDKIVYGDQVSGDKIRGDKNERHAGDIGPGAQGDIGQKIKQTIASVIKKVVEIARDIAVK